MARVVGSGTTGQIDPPGRDEWLRVADAARLLGVSANTLRRAASYRDLCCHRSPGGHRRYRRSDVEALLAAGERGEAAPVGARAAAGSRAVTVAPADDVVALRRRIDDLSALVDVSLEVTARFAEGADEVLRTVARRLCDLSGAPECEVSRLEGDELVGLVRLAGGSWDGSWEGRRTALGDVPLSAAAIRTGRPNAVTSLDDGRLGQTTRGSMERWGYQSCVTLPMIAHGRVVGIVELLDRAPRDAGLDLDAATSLAQTAAHALENARLMQRVQRQNAALGELVGLGSLIGETRDPSAMARAVARRVREVTGAALCGIYRVEDGDLACLAIGEEPGRRPSGDGRRRPLSELPFAAAVVAVRQPLVVTDPSDRRLGAAEREPFVCKGFRSQVSVPLVVDERVVGLIDLFSRAETDWADELDFLRSVGQLVAGALENAVLVTRLRERTRELDFLVESGLDVGANLDLDRVLTATARRMAELAGVTGCDLYRIEGGAAFNLMSVENGAVDEAFVGLSFPVRDYFYWERAVTERRPVFAEDILTDPAAYEGDREAARAWGYRATLDLPLIAGGEVIGLADLYGVEPIAFRNVDLLQALGQVAAQAIANASLYRERDRSARRLELVAAQSLELSATLDLDAVVAAAARSLRESGGFADSDVFTIEGAELVCVASVVGTHDDPGRIGTRLPLRDWGTVREAVETRRAVAVESLDDPRVGPVERSVRQSFAVRSALIVPLIAKDRVVAVVELVDKHRRRSYDAEQVATVEALSRVAGLALDNAELYGDIKRLHLSNLKALSSALNAKDYYTLGHAARVAAYMVLLGKELGWTPELIQHVEEAAYLHDIGKIGVSDRVLLKPSGLNAHEWELMRQHPVFSADIIRPLFDEALVAGVRHHHERFDGAGYPDGLGGAAIPEIARVMCVADSYDAMSFRRPYRQARSYEECLAELRRCSGTQFDPRVAEAFICVLRRLRQRKRQALEVARLGAARLDAAAHASFDSPAAATTTEYAAAAAALREVRDANPPTRYLGTRARLAGTFVIAVDIGYGTEEPTPFGSEVFADDELPEAFAGAALDTVVLYVDEWGVWVSGLAPLRAADGTVVAVVAADMPPPGADEAEMEGLRSDVTQTFASMLRSAAARLGRAEIEAVTDGLTGLYNHRYLHERLDEEVERARAEGAPLSLLLCDVDRFKAFNDEFGHSMGDEALRVVARVVESSIRHVDLAARYGGGSFAVILVGTDAEGALEVAERLRTGVAGARAGVQIGALRVSVGAATFPHDAGTKAELLDKADWAMHLAKRQGRDRVHSFRRTAREES